MCAKGMGLYVLRPLGKSPLSPGHVLRSRACWVSDSLMGGSVMRISVCDWKVGVDPFWAQ